MDKNQKYEFTESIETYLEENQVYDLFEKLLQQLLLKKPEKPLEFLIERIQQSDQESKCKFNFNKSVRRVFLMGPPGS
jgi:adenylate kinase